MVNLLNLGNVTSGYGTRRAPTKGASTNHKGVDIVLRNKSIPSVLSGTVLSSGYNSSAGNFIKIKQSDGTIATYMHMAAKSPYSAGDTVREGQTIGIMGSTGISTGDHLHFQVEKNGAIINPQTYLSSGVVGSVSTNSTAFSTTGGESSGGWLKETALDFVGHIITFVVVLLVVVLAVVFFTKAFEIKIF